MGSCHATFLTVPAREGFNEAARGRLRLAASQPDPPRPWTEPPSRPGRAPRPSPGKERPGRRRAAPAAAGEEPRQGCDQANRGGGGRQEEDGGRRSARVQLPARPDFCVCVFPSALRFGSCVSSYLSGLFPSAAVKKQWQAGGSRPGSPGDAK